MKGIAASFPTPVSKGEGFFHSPECPCLLDRAGCKCQCVLLMFKSVNRRDSPVLQCNIRIPFFYKTIGGVTFVTFAALQHGENGGKQAISLFAAYAK